MFDRISREGVTAARVLLGLVVAVLASLHPFVGAGAAMATWALFSVIAVLWTVDGPFTE